MKPGRARALAIPDLTLRFSGAVLLAALLIAYCNAPLGSFQFDDYNVIVDNPAVHSLSAWWHSMPGIRPLLKLSYTVNWLIAPVPAAFIAVNIFCHALNSLLVLMLCRKLCAERLASSSHAAATASLAAAIFALHPAQTEAVTYICGRSVTLMSLFYLAGLLSGCSERWILHWICSPLLFALALLTKETAWTLPLALLLVRRQLRQQRGEQPIATIRCLWPHGLVLLGVGGALLAGSGYRRMLEHIWSLRSPLANLGWQVDGVFYLLTRPLLALHTNIDPDLSSLGALAPWWWPKLLVLAALLVWGFRARSALSRFAVLWFALQLLPTNSLWPRNDIANDRQLYLALIGPALWFGHRLMGLGQFLTGPANAVVNGVDNWPRRTAPIIAIALILALMAATLSRNADYRDEISLWQATARSSPNKARVWNNLGYAYQIKGRVEDARKAYIYAQILDPNNDRARINHLLLPGQSVVPGNVAPANVVPERRGE